MGSIISKSGSVNTSQITSWQPGDRQVNAAGGLILASPLNTDLLLCLTVLAGDDGPSQPLSLSTPGVKVIPPGCWIDGTGLDNSNQIFLQAASGSQAYTCEDLTGLVVAGLRSGGFAAQSTSSSSSPSAPSAVINLPAPASFAQGQDWNVPGGFSKLITQLGPGQSCSIAIVDSEGNLAVYENVTAQEIEGLQGPLVIKAPANGSTNCPPNIILRQVAAGAASALPSRQFNAPPSFATGTNWSLDGAKEIYTGLPVGATCTIGIVDQFGNTAFYKNVGSVLSGLSGPIVVLSAANGSQNCPSGLIARN